MFHSNSLRRRHLKTFFFCGNPKKWIEKFIQKKKSLLIFRVRAINTRKKAHTGWDCQIVWNGVLLSPDTTRERNKKKEWKFCCRYFFFLFGVFVHFIENDSTSFDWKLFSHTDTHTNPFWLRHLNASLSMPRNETKKKEWKYKVLAHPQCRHIIDVKRRKRKKM